MKKRIWIKRRDGVRQRYTCGNSIIKGDLVCPKCGSNKGGFDTFVNRTDMVQCGNCGHIMREDERIIYGSWRIDKAKEFQKKAIENPAKAKAYKERIKNMALSLSLNREFGEPLSPEQDKEFDKIFAIANEIPDNYSSLSFGSILTEEEEYEEEKRRRAGKSKKEWEAMHITDKELLPLEKELSNSIKILKSSDAKKSKKIIENMRDNLEEYEQIVEDFEDRGLL